MFRTPVEPEKGSFPISHNTPVMLLGSCFSENIGNKLHSLKFNVDINPFGALYNPVSICNSIKRLIEMTAFTEAELFCYNESWHSFMHHSKFSSPDKNICLRQINERFNYSSEFLKKTECLIITFGTAWIFYHLQSKQVVSNCHKLPANNFERQLLSSEKIVHLFESIIKSLKNINPKLKILFTVSPVRHLKDKAEGNQLSKAKLVVAVHELCNKGYGCYFPAYEIMLDDLRDYRFYNTDMVHPSDQAIDYIFEKFANSWFNEDTQKLNTEITGITNAVNHRPMNPQAVSFKNFAGQILDKIELLEKQHPFLNFAEEKEYFENFV